MCWKLLGFFVKVPGVSVAGCLGYDVLDTLGSLAQRLERFSCWLFRL